MSSRRPDDPDLKYILDKMLTVERRLTRVETIVYVNLIVLITTLIKTLIS